MEVIASIVVVALVLAYVYRRLQQTNIPVEDRADAEKNVEGLSIRDSV